MKRSCNNTIFHMNIFDHIYGFLPLRIQNLVVSSYGLYWHQLRFGSGYSQFVQGYQERERFTKEQWQVWQAEQLKNLLPVCVNHVPYYRDHWTEAQKYAAFEWRLERSSIA